MIKHLILLIIVAFRTSIQPAEAQIQNVETATTSPVASAGFLSKPASFISINGSVQNNKVIIDWTVAENETADKFEIEKSTDGINFTMAALVFGTDKPATGIYQFYEKATGIKAMYRIKLINKNKETAYSTVITISADNL